MDSSDEEQNNRWSNRNHMCVFLEEKYEENRDFLSDFRKERFQEFYDKYGDQDKNLMKIIKDEVDVTIINGYNEIHK